MMDIKIISKYALNTLTLEERAEHGLLNEAMTLQDIVQLAESDHNNRNRLLLALCNAYKKDNLKGCEKPQYNPLFIRNLAPKSNNCLMINKNKRINPSGITVTRDDYESFLKSGNDWPPPNGSLLRNWWPKLKLVNNPNSQYQRIEYIINTINNLDFNPQAIPYGGKNTIKIKCTNDYPKITSSMFERAWASAVQAGTVKMSGSSRAPKSSRRNIHRKPNINQ